MRPRPNSRILLSLFLWGSLLLSVPGLASAARYEIEDGESEVRFTSRASIESFEGHTHEVRGWAEVDPASLTAGVRWSIEVDLASLDTGIGLRNRHMRENHLHTDRFPVATFEGEIAAGEIEGRLVVGQPTTLEIPGVFTLHGVEKPRTIEASVSLDQAGALRIDAAFGVVLSDHDIPRPKFLMLKLAEEQQVEIHLRALPPTPAAQESHR